MSAERTEEPLGFEQSRDVTDGDFFFFFNFFFFLSFFSFSWATPTAYGGFQARG